MTPEQRKEAVKSLTRLTGREADYAASSNEAFTLGKRLNEAKDHADHMFDLGVKRGREAERNDRTEGAAPFDGPPATTYGAIVIEQRFKQMSEASDALLARVAALEATVTALADHTTSSVNP